MRHRREKEKVQAQGVAALNKPQGGSTSSTMDALQRMAAGLEGRTIRDQIDNANRPTWEQYKEANKDKLNLDTAETKQMADYRRQLDKEREDRLREIRKRPQTNRRDSDDSDEGRESSSDGDSSSIGSDDSDGSRDRKRRRKEKKSKKGKKGKKAKKEKKKKKKEKKEKKEKR